MPELTERDFSSGYITAVRGNVVDVRFTGVLPPRHAELHTGKAGNVILEVQTHLDRTDRKSVV